jgi:anaerobic magnesium-protoporphyrin IX monomethyl ester cyclase
MKVLLIQPYTVTPNEVLPYMPQEPLGLECLAAYLKKYSPGTTVRILDCIAEHWQEHVQVSDEWVRVGASDSEIRNVVCDFKPDLVGVPFQFYNQEEAVKSITALVKRVSPLTTVVVGGASANADPGGLMKRIGSIDIVVSGEGEETLRELTLPLELRKWKTIEEVEGITYRAGSRIVTNKPRPFIEDLARLPTPDRKATPFNVYSLSFMTSSPLDRLRLFWIWYRYNRDWPTFKDALMTSRARAKPRVAAIECARGCPYHCYFCASQNVWDRKHRQKPVKRVLYEMAYLYQQFKVRTFHVMDDNFNVNEKWVNEFCRMLPLAIPERIELRFQSGFFPRISRDTLANLKKAGMKDVLFGIESGNQRVLDEVIRKPVNLRHVEQIIKWCHELGIICGGFFVMGIPGETLSDMQDTINFALNCGLDRVRFYICQPMPGSLLYDDCVKNGWLADGYDPAKGLIVGGNSFIRTPEFTPDQVMSLAAAGREALRKKGLLYQKKT